MCIFGCAEVTSTKYKSNHFKTRAALEVVGQHVRSVKVAAPSRLVKPNGRENHQRFLDPSGNRVGGKRGEGPARCRAPVRQSRGPPPGGLSSCVAVPVAAALAGPLAWEPLYSAGAALKRKLLEDSRGENQVNLGKEVTF